MQKLIAVISKELLLLWRDKAGLLVLFVMPAFLVVVITLVQENVLKVMGESSINVLFIDFDKNDTGSTIKRELAALANVTLVERIDGVQLTRQSTLDLISRGKYQFGVILPEGFTKALKTHSRQTVEDIITRKAKEQSEQLDMISEVELYFDPAVRGGFKTTILTTLKQILFSLEIKEKLFLLSQKIPEQVEKTMSEAFGEDMMPANIGENLPDFDFTRISKSVFKVKGKYAARSSYEILPTSVQQNVPAWSMFGIFFIVVPLAGTLLKEKHEGTFARLRTMPVSFLTLISGKIIAYQLICFGQFLLIAAIGHYLLPALGTPAFELDGNLAAMLILVFTASLAATGYGVMLGSVSRTFEQVSMFGPISIVAAAAIGGVMVPVFAMPEFMRLASVISPLNWGLEGFMDIFVRGGSVVEIVPEATRFVLFFIIMISLSLVFLRNKL